MKFYLLIAGHSYYPQARTDDWIKCFETYEEASAQVKEIQHQREITKGKRKGELENTYKTYDINDNNYDWYEIVDLVEWIR